MTYDDWKLATPPEYDQLPYGPQEGEEQEHEDQDPSDGYPNPDVDLQLHERDQHSK